ncbi:MAG: squalene/phytoene synthase family protein [Minwuiales bacterium]|nr:squalene/phytoene synthase family protein [Minwuiales bacterium]
MAASHPLSYCATQVRRDDHDRFLTALFAPGAIREDLFALYAFNLELAKTREQVSEAILGEIRLQWWRETVDEIFAGKRREHPVVEALADAVETHELDRGLMDRLIDARAADLTDDPPTDTAALEDYARGTSSGLMQLALQVLDARTGDADTAADHAGIGWALAGLIRAVPFHGAQGRVYLPRDLLEAEGLNIHATAHDRNPEKIRRVAHRLAEAAAEHLRQARAHRTGIPKKALPALLPASLADLYLIRLRQADYDLSDPRLDVSAPRRQFKLLWNALRGRY